MRSCLNVLDRFRRLPNPQETQERYLINLSSTTYEEHFERYWPDYVFLKNPHWSYEQEWRCAVVGVDVDEIASIDVRPSVAGIVVGPDVSSESADILRAFVTTFDIADAVGRIDGSDWLGVGGMPPDLWTPGS